MKTGLSVIQRSAALLSAILMSASLTSASVKLIENTTSRVVFTIDVSDCSLHKAEDRSGYMPTYNGQTGTVAGPGGIMLPAQSVMIAVPPSGDAAVSVEASGTSTLPAAELAIDTTLLSSSGDWLAAKQISYLRTIRVMKLILSPVRLSSGQLFRASQLRITVTFPSAAKPGTATVPSGAFWSACKSSVLNLANGFCWYGPVGSHALAKAHASQRLSLPALSSKLVRFEIGDGVSGFNEMTDHEGGVLSIDSADIYRLFGTTARVSDISLYTATRGNLPEHLPDSSGIPAGIIKVPLLKIAANKNGLLGSKDRILACITGPNGWLTDSAKQKAPVFKCNDYSATRSYWLALDGAGTDVSNLVQPDTMLKDSQTEFYNRVKFAQRKDLRYVNESSTMEPSKGSRHWIWTRLTLSNNMFQQIFDSHDLPGIDTSKVGRAMLTVSTSTTVVAALGKDSLVSSNGFNCAMNKWGIGKQGTCTLSVQYSGGTKSSPAEIVSLDLGYYRKMNLGSDSVMRIYSDTTDVAKVVPTIKKYRLDGLVASDTTWIFRIAPLEASVQLVGSYTGKTFCTWIDTANLGYQYVVSRASAFKSVPVDAQRLSAEAKKPYLVTDIMSSSNSADMIIIAPPDYLDLAEQLAEHKQHIASKQRSVIHNPVVINAEDIYRNFSGGTADPTAIRNFLVNVMDTDRTVGWKGKPDFVLLFGGGHWDYKNVITTKKVYLPVYESDDEKCEDGYFSIVGYTDNNPNSLTNPSVILGRINCFSEDDAKTAVDKIIQYEGDTAEFGEWRNRYLLVSDDDRQGFNVQDGIVHVLTSDSIGAILRSELPSAEIRKVNLFEYPCNSTALKPAAATAIINELNNGISIINWVGHGGEGAWADEGILNASSIASLTNKKKYPLMNSFSCSVGYFDEPAEGASCLCDKMIFARDKGTIGSIAATRTAYVSDNGPLAKSLFNFLSTGDGNLCFGQAYLSTQLSTTKKKNYVPYYCYLGDPSVRSAYSPDTVLVSMLVSDTAKDTLKALQTVVFSGRVMTGGAVASSYDSGSSYVSIELFQPDNDSVTRKDGLSMSTQPEYIKDFPSHQVTYNMPGAPIMSGLVPVVRGHFSFKAILPRNLPFDKKGVRFQAFAWNGDRCARGYRGDIVFHGISSSATLSDKTGPVIAIKPVCDSAKFNSNYSFSLPSDTIKAFLPLILSIEAYDESGIDVNGTGPDEGICAEIPGLLPEQNYNGTFVFSGGNYKRGSTVIQLDKGKAAPGNYQLNASAKDMLGNLSRKSVTLSITDEADVKLGDVFNYPNPARVGKSTKFFYQQSVIHPQVQMTNIYADVFIYTLSGRLVRVMRNAANGAEWDLRDATGKPMPPNVYLYRVLLHSPDSEVSGQEKVTKSAVKKLVILPPG